MNPADPGEWLAGGCHCGRVRFRARGPERTALNCNCSICLKKGFLHWIVPPKDFELQRDSEALTSYRFNTGVADHTFCSVCGIHAFYRPRSHPKHFDVNVNCLDGDAKASFAVRDFDGENWEDHVEDIR